MDVEKLLGLYLCLTTLLPHKTTFLWVARPRDGSARGLGAEGWARTVPCCCFHFPKSSFLFHSFPTGPVLGDPLPSSSGGEGKVPSLGPLPTVTEAGGSPEVLGTTPTEKLLI